MYLFPCLGNHFRRIIGRFQAFHTACKTLGVSVEQHVAAVAKELGGKIAVKSFVRFERGEGIEKKQEDFAAEVAAQMNMGK